MVASAPPVGLGRDEFKVLDDTFTDGVRRLRARITSPREVRVYNIAVDPGTEVSAAVLNGKRLDYTAALEQGHRGGWLELSYVGVPDEGIELALETKSTGPLKLRLVSYADGLPAVPGFDLKPRPEGLMPSPSSDTTRVVTNLDLGPPGRAQQ
jgi:hypothetical protein